MVRDRFYRSLQKLIDQLAALVFLSGAIGLALIAMAMREPEPLVLGDWQEERPWHWPEQPLAPLQVSLYICMVKTPDSPERVC